MAKKELVEIKIHQGETPNSKIYVISQSIKGLSIYERAKAINHFIEKETKVLETCIENELRAILISYGIIASDGSESALNEAFYKLRALGKDIVIYDRYNELNNERIIGEKNNMTVINEDDILSAAMEVEVVDYGG